MFKKLSSLLQGYLTSGDWDDVEDLEERLASYKSECTLSE